MRFHVYAIYLKSDLQEDQQRKSLDLSTLLMRREPELGTGICASHEWLAVFRLPRWLADCAYPISTWDETHPGLM